MARFDGLVIGQYKISLSFPNRFVPTTYRGLETQATVVTGETTAVFVGVNLLSKGDHIET